MNSGIVRPSSMALSPEQLAVLARWPNDALSHAALPGPLATVTINEVIDPVRLQAAVEMVLRRHEALQVGVGILANDESPRQYPAIGGQRWHIVDLTDAAEQTQSLHTWLDGLAQTPLAISEGDTIRVGLAHLVADRFVLVLAASPVVADTASLRILLNDIAVAYGGDALKPSQDELLQYSQFILWRQTLAADEEAKAGEAYWQRFMADASGIEAPRLRHHRRGEISAGMAQHEQRLILPLVAGDGSNVAVTAQAAWWLLLARLEDWQPFLGGWKNDCRADYEPMQGAIGVFGKVLPVLIDPAKTESFDAWRQRLAATMQSHVGAQEFLDIVTPPLTAHLQTFFSFERAASVNRSGWLPSPAGVDSISGGLGVHVQAVNDALEIAISGDAGCFDTCVIERLTKQYMVLLTAAFHNPQKAVADLPMSDDEDHAVLVSKAGPRLQFDFETMPQVIARWAKSMPEARAVEAGTATRDYADLFERAGVLAAWLSARGVTPGTLVALALPRGIELIEAIVAVWRAGAAYLPIDPQWPSARREALLQDARPVLLLTDSAENERAIKACPAFSFESVDWTSASTKTVPEQIVRPEDLAYVLYTSGSTGTPKGVAISHGALLNYAAAASHAMQLADARRFALTSSVVADLGNTTLFGALYNGGCLVIASAEEATDAARFAAFLSRSDIDVLKIVPSHLAALLEGNPLHLPRCIILGGEPASATLLARIREIAPHSVLYNHYGPTETAVGVLVHRMNADDVVQPLTEVLANNHVYVLDDVLQPAPVGVPGCLYIGGAQLLSGYLGRDTMGLIEDPYRKGERLYNTGDRAVVLPTGGFELLGRADHQVKIRGFRVDPAEVEQVLAGLPGVHQAAVIAEPDAQAVSLKACVVLDAGIDIASLREQLAALLPAAMIPAGYVALSALPRLPNGKIDRIALVHEMPSSMPSSVVGKLPSDPLEQILARGMSIALGREVTHVDEDFFDLGAHSLVVIKFVARLRKLLNIEMAPALVFDYPTVACLAAALRETHAEPGLEAAAEHVWREWQAGNELSAIQPLSTAGAA